MDDERSRDLGCLAALVVLVLLSVFLWAIAVGLVALAAWAMP